MRRCGSPKDQMRDSRSILDGVMLRQKTAEAAATDNDLVVSGKMLPHTLNIIDDLFKCVRLGQRALAVPAIVE